MNQSDGSETGFGISVAEWPVAEVGKPSARFGCERRYRARETAFGDAGLHLDAKGQWRFEPKVDTEL